MSTYWPEFLLVAMVHLIGVISPGPDFALVFRQSIKHGRATAIWSSVGIGTGILVHVSYSLFGLSLLIRESVLLFNLIKYAGATYFVYMGIKAVRTSKRQSESFRTDVMPPANHGAFLTGFLVNVLNPKAGLFFIAIFSMIISPDTPAVIRAAYGLWLTLSTIAWFSLVSVIFTHARVRQFFLRFGHWFDRVMGVLFIAIAIRMTLMTLS